VIPATPPSARSAYDLSRAMKTGRLLKFNRPGGEIHAYFYRDGSLVRAAVYTMSAGRDEGAEPMHAVTGPSEAHVEAEVRAWVEAHYPKVR
jgi:hypothetical protein